MLTHEDKELLAKKGIPEKQIEEQLACFEKGFPYLQLAAAASVDNNGIMIADADAQKKKNIWQHGMLIKTLIRKS